jgi:hypothetical protein
MHVDWVTAKGQRIPIGAMETSHIQNTIAMLREGRRLRRFPYHGFSRHEWILILSSELVRRSQHST